MPKVSVIVPVYNVEKYIERCVRSLFEQTLDDIEYIFVDDCSPDNSISIVKSVSEDYPNRKNNIKYCIHNKNRGLTSTRNTGLAVATGDFIAHCDSDDWVTKDAYQIMYEAAISEDADMTICDFFISDGVTHRPYYNSLDNNEENNLFVYINIWTRLVKRSLYKNEIH